jgi:hypothetical protein
VTHGKIKLRHVASFLQVVWCHMVLGMGCHVAPCLWYVKSFIMEVVGFEPQTSTIDQSLDKGHPTGAPHYVS